MSNLEDEKVKNKISETMKVHENSLKSPLQTSSVESVIKIAPLDACLWAFKDRQPFDMGNINELAEQLKTQGQTVPIIVRHAPENSVFKYEIIAGERRWRAAKIANLKLDAIIRKMNDTEALIAQTTENSSRKSISDYSRGMGYQRLIDHQVITTAELRKKLHLKKSTMNNLLSFAQVPKIIWDEVADMSKVSARTSAVIRAFANKGEAYIDVLIKIAPQIREGIGDRRLKDLVKENMNIKTQQTAQQYPEKIISDTGAHLFTWHNEENNQLIFSDKVINKINFDKIKNLLKVAIEQELDANKEE